MTKKRTDFSAITKHGHNRGGGQRSPEYRAWANMRTRCRTDFRQRADYAGRGITVCERWLKFENFLADVGLRPSPAHTLDRKDNSIGYEPGNCRWATRVEQANNKRNNRLMTVEDETLPVAEWARRTGLPYTTIIWRLNNGRSGAEAIQ